MIREHHITACLAIPLIIATHALGQQADDLDIPLSATVQKLLDDPLIDAQHTRAMQIFHGQWEQIGAPTVAEQAAIALARFDLSHRALRDPNVPASLRAEAALWRGELEAVTALLEGASTAQDAILRARSLEQLGRLPDALEALGPWRHVLENDQIDNPAELVAATHAMLLLAQLEGQSAMIYKLAMRLFAKARTELDRLYWPALVAEARLLMEKDNASEAAGALLAALSFNPRASEAWYLLGQLATESFQFDRAARIVRKLRVIHPSHLLADLLESQMYLTQRDADSSRAVVESALRRYPKQRMLIALWAATEAIAYEQNVLAAALQRFDDLAPHSSLALFTVGKYLSSARQYRDSEVMFNAAIQRQPNWPPPRIELGLMLMQTGEEEKALNQLQHAVQLDSFNRQANNQLKLVRELVGYEQIRTERFLIKYRKGVDEVLARDMVHQLDAMSNEITSVFQHQPRRLTQIQIMPDEYWFGVRITGIPEIWTVAACTGDVIAIVPPRDGPGQRGTFDWSRAVGHEYVHTVTLDQTDNRVQHWFTEACAVSQEPGGREYETCQLLATALNAAKLFDLNEINWAFVRPKNPQSRPLAYAQAHWMLEYIISRFGYSAVIEILSSYRRGAGNEDAITAATGVSPEEFMAQFTKWAQVQVRDWGLEPVPANPTVEVALRNRDNVTDAQLAELIHQYPGHPELLLLAAQHALARSDPETARRAVLRYAAVRPVDLWPHRVLVELALATQRLDEVIGSLEQLDRQDAHTGYWANQLAKFYRVSGRYDVAAKAITRALHREPYNASYRELAATIALQRSPPKRHRALHHLLAIALLEPEFALHQVRLAALYTQMGQRKDARRAAQKAMTLDPDAPVSKFIE